MATGTTERARTRGRWLRRFGWLVLLWIAGVASTGALAMLMRYLMAWAGLVR